MSVHPDTHKRITELQKDVSMIKEELEDQWHERRQVYEDRVKKVLIGDKNATTLYLEIDGLRSINEIEKQLEISQRRIPHKSLWRACLRLKESGLIVKTDVKDKSLVYSKRPWANALNIDNYVRTKILS
jgi:hypothetical protein